MHVRLALLFVSGFAMSNCAPTEDSAQTNSGEIASTANFIEAQATGKACSGIAGTDGIDHLEVECGICKALPSGQNTWAAYQCRNGEPREVPNSCVYSTPDSCKPLRGHICAPYGPHRDPNWTEYFYVGTRACVKTSENRYDYLECQDGGGLRMVEANVKRSDARCEKVIEPST